MPTEGDKEIDNEIYLYRRELLRTLVAGGDDRAAGTAVLPDWQKTPMLLAGGATALAAVAAAELTVPGTEPAAISRLLANCKDIKRGIQYKISDIQTTRAPFFFISYESIRLNVCPHLLGQRFAVDCLDQLRRRAEKYHRALRHVGR